jgi:hypothetical protein
MRWITILGLESTALITRALVEELTQEIGHTRRERRDVRQQLKALAFNDLAEEQRRKSQDAKAKRRCGAFARSTGKPCQAPALANGRCKLHGGLSTGPRTAEGRARIGTASRRRWAAWRAARDAARVPREIHEDTR